MKKVLDFCLTDLFLVYFAVYSSSSNIKKPLFAFPHQSSPERYVKDAFQWMLPFLHRCEGQRAGAARSFFAEYLISLAQRDLALPLIICQHSKPDASTPAHIHTHTSEGGVKQMKPKANEICHILGSQRLLCV